MEIVALPSDRIGELYALYDGYDRPPCPRLSPERSRSILDHIRKQDGEIYVVLVDGAFAGSYSLYVCHGLNRGGRPFAVIENVICSPVFRRRGIGKAMMAHAVSMAQKAECYKVLLQTGAGRTENHAFYEACGFQSSKRGYQIRFDKP